MSKRTSKSKAEPKGKAKSKRKNKPNSTSRSQRKPLYLEDFAVGQQFVTSTHAITEDEIMRFATQFDPQPFHLDHAAADASVFRGLAASGWHTASLTMRLLVDSGMHVAGGLIGVGGEVEWPRPTRPGDVLRVATEVVAVRPSRSKPTSGIVTLRNRTLNQRDEELQIAVMKLFVARNPAAAKHEK